MGASAANNSAVSIGDGASPIEAFTPLIGVQLTRLRVQHDAINRSELRSHVWQMRSEATGSSSLEIGLEGVFMNDAASAMLQAMALAHEQRNIRLRLANDDVIEGAFVVTLFERAGAADAIESFSATLVNASIITLS